MSTLLLLDQGFSLHCSIRADNSFLYSAHAAWSTISDIADVIRPKATNRADFIAECGSGALDGVSVTYRTFDSAKITGKVDSELLDALPKSIKFLCHNGERMISRPQSLLDRQTDVEKRHAMLTRVGS